MKTVNPTSMISFLLPKAKAKCNKLLPICQYRSVSASFPNSYGSSIYKVVSACDQ